MDVVGAAACAVFATALPDGEHRCARCGRGTGQLTPAGRVVSAKFTGFDDWVGPPTGGVCRDCEWALHTKGLRLHPLVVHRTTPSVTTATRSQLATLLDAPLPLEVSVTVPLRPGRKHLLPSARWGHVTTDDATLRWGSGDATRLQAMQRLRRSGFGGRMLIAPPRPGPFCAASIPPPGPGPWRTGPDWTRGARPPPGCGSGCTSPSPHRRPARPADVTTPRHTILREDGD